MGKARSREQSEVKVSWQCPRGSGGRWRESVKQALCLLLRSVDGHHRCPGRIHFFCSLLLVIFSCPVSSLLHHAGTPVWSAGTVSSWLCENSSTSLATWRWANCSVSHWLAGRSALDASCCVPWPTLFSRKTSCHRAPVTVITSPGYAGMVFKPTADSPPADKPLLTTTWVLDMLP